MRGDLLHQLNDRQVLGADTFTLAAGNAVGGFPVVLRQLFIIGHLSYVSYQPLMTVLYSITGGMSYFSTDCRPGLNRMMTISYFTDIPAEVEAATDVSG